jgi:hypothetical protein
MPTAFTHSTQEKPGAMSLAAGEVDWHKAESYYNVININSPMATQA